LRRGPQLRVAKGRTATPVRVVLGHGGGDYSAIPVCFGLRRPMEVCEQMCNEGFKEWTLSSLIDSEISSRISKIAAFAHKGQPPGLFA